MDKLAEADLRGRVVAQAFISELEKIAALPDLPQLNPMGLLRRAQLETQIAGEAAGAVPTGIRRWFPEFVLKNMPGSTEGAALKTIREQQASSVQSVLGELQGRRSKILDQIRQGVDEKGNPLNMRLAAEELREIDKSLGGFNWRQTSVTPFPTRMSESDVSRYMIPQGTPEIGGVPAMGTPSDSNWPSPLTIGLAAGVPLAALGGAYYLSRPSQEDVYGQAYGSGYGG